MEFVLHFECAQHRKLFDFSVANIEIASFAEFRYKMHTVHCTHTQELLHAAIRVDFFFFDTMKLESYFD